MTYIIPPNMNDSMSRVVIEGKEYLIRFTYCSDGDYWTFGLYMPDKSPIFTALKLVPCYPLNLYCLAPDMPNGLFVVYSNLDHVGRNAFLSGEAKFAFVPFGEIMEAT